MSERKLMMKKREIRDLREILILKFILENFKLTQI